MEIGLKTEEKIQRTWKFEKGCLILEKTITIFEIKKKPYCSRHIRTKISSSKEIEMKLSLRKTSIKELANLRKSNISGFVLKIKKNLYFAEIDKETKLLNSNIFGKSLSHLCGKCKRLNPDTFENGGCEKVLYNSSEIEKFDWIMLGYETFNTSLDCFIVLSCNHFKS